MKFYITIILLFLLPKVTWGQVDSIPLLKASLMIGEPTDLYPQSVFGHAYLRLQCPSARLDNSFSMESGDYEGFLDICTGNYPNRLAVIINDDYLKSFAKEGRIVKEYPLNLTQAEIQRLWKYLDEKSNSGESPYHDFFHHGCSQEIIRFLSENINGQIQYGDIAKNYRNTLFSLGIQTLPKSSWIRIPFSMLLCTDGTDRKISDAEKTAVPYIIPDLFADARIIDDSGISRPIFTHSGPIIYAPPTHHISHNGMPIYHWIITFLIIIIAASIIGLKYPWIGKATDVLIILLYSFIVIVLITINMISSLPTTSGWNWNFLIYNPIPLIVMIFGTHSSINRSNTYMLYALWISAFLSVIAIVGNHYITEQYILALTFTFRCLFKAITLKSKTLKIN